MKYLFFITALYAAVFFQSAIEELRVPEVQETPQIDSLVDRGIPQAMPNKSCMLLDFRTTGKLFVVFYSIRKIDTSLIDLGIKRINGRWTLNYTDSLCFFKYRGYFVFACGEINRFNFFTKKKHLRRFKFLNSYTEKEERYPALNEIYLHVDKYENNKFVPLNEGGPDLK